MRAPPPAFILACLALGWGLPAGPAHAHVPEGAVAPPSLGSAFTLEPWLIVPLLLASALYAVGLTRSWVRAGVGRGVRVWEACAHGGGLLALCLALVWPLDALGEWSLAAHMAQHMLLVAVAAPLLLLGRPGVVWLATLPRRWTARVAATLRVPLANGSVALLTGMGTATLLQAAVMWGWHAPSAMELALRSDAVHYAMHASFLAAGLAFWWALLRSVREQGPGFGAGAIALIGTMMQMGLLSALLTFAPAPRYPFYVGRVEALGLTALEDQQLAGLIMWVPSALPYLIGILALTGWWLRRVARDDALRAAAGKKGRSGFSRDLPRGTCKNRG